MPNSLVGPKRKNFIIYLLSVFLLNQTSFITPVMAHELLREGWVASYGSPLVRIVKNGSGASLDDFSQFSPTAFEV